VLRSLARPSFAAFVQSWKAQSQETQGLFKVSQQAFDGQPTESATLRQGAGPLSFNRQAGFCIFNRKFHFAFLTRGIMQGLCTINPSAPCQFVVWVFHFGGKMHFCLCYAQYIQNIQENKMVCLFVDKTIGQTV
jgi:hypothetical protein